MSLTLEGINIDANDHVVVGRFWAELLGWEITEYPTGSLVKPPPGVAGIEIPVIKVPEGKAGKNRLHLDLESDQVSADADRAVALGARRVSVGQPQDAPWEVLADPEGNEFCIAPRSAPSRSGD